MTPSHSRRGVLFASILILLCGVVSLAAQKPYYPPRGDNNWARKTPAEVGMDAKLLEAALDFARANETRAFATEPLENLKQRATREQSGEILGPTRPRAPAVNAILGQPRL